MALSTFSRLPRYNLDFRHFDSQQFEDRKKNIDPTAGTHLYVTSIVFYCSVFVQWPKTFPKP
jgi:hypothetical protein